MEITKQGFDLCRSRGKDVLRPPQEVASPRAFVRCVFEHSMVFKISSL